MAPARRSNVHLPGCPVCLARLESPCYRKHQESMQTFKFERFSSTPSPAQPGNTNSESVEVGASESAGCSLLLSCFDAEGITRGESLTSCQTEELTTVVVSVSTLAMTAAAGGFRNLPLDSHVRLNGSCQTCTCVR